jgi:hypothetical protein
MINKRKFNYIVDNNNVKEVLKNLWVSNNILLIIR